MRKTIASEYFNLCIALIIVSMVIVGVGVAGCADLTYRAARKAALDSESLYARQYTEELATDDDGNTGDTGMGDGAAEELERLYMSVSAHTGMTLTLFDSYGHSVVCSDGDNCSCRGKTLPVEVMRSADGDGEFYTGLLGGFLDRSSIAMVYSAGQSGYFMIIDTAGGEQELLKRMGIVFCAIAALVLLVVWPILKYSVDRTLKPVKEMTIAAKRFGEGDFSEKVSVSDRSEMGFLAKTLNEMASSLDAIEENRKSFISNVSHELRTPMTTIGGFVDGILDGTIPESQQRKYLITVSEEIDRLARLVRSMLNISKYEAGEMELSTEDFDVTALTVKTVLLFEKRIEDKGLDIRGLDADRFFVNADADLTQQVIYNLTENAVKFVNKGGYISYAFRQENGRIVISIKNSGEGLKENEINKVFDRFYKTDASRGKDKSGVGLGLSIVRSIVKLHEGNVLVRSVPGEYTEFEFSLPEGSRPARREV